MPGAGRPTWPDLHVVRVGADRERRGLGHAEAGEHADALAACRCSATRVELVPHRLRQAGAGEEEHLHAAEEASRAAARRPRSAFGDLLEALRHVEVDRRRDLAQVAQRLADQRRRRLAVVDVERAAVVERRCRRCGCRRRCGSTAASRPAPAAPRRAREALRASSAGCAQHALRVDHAPWAAWSSRR